MKAVKTQPPPRVPGDVRQLAVMCPRGRLSHVKGLAVLDPGPFTNLVTVGAGLWLTRPLARDIGRPMYRPLHKSLQRAALGRWDLLNQLLAQTDPAVKYRSRGIVCRQLVLTTDAIVHVAKRPFSEATLFLTHEQVAAWAPSSSRDSSIAA